MQNNNALNNASASAGPGRVACDVCLKDIPRSVAQSEEGTDYVYYFCGPECYERWRNAPAMRQIGVMVEGRALDFECAQRLAAVLAPLPGEEVMPVAWFDRTRGRASPEVPECQHRPGWLAYAESHGGNVTVEINRGEYVFVYAV